MIVNIRGTNGSGKSTLIRQFMERYEATPLHDANGKEEGYECNGGSNAYVVGRYTTACGGCDTIKTQQETKDRVDRYAVRGNVLFEGILVSTIYGPWLQFSRERGGMLWAFLNTPLDICLERIQIRNGGRPVKEDQVAGKWSSMERIKSRAVADGERIIVLNYRNALEELVTALVPNRYQKVA